MYLSIFSPAQALVIILRITGLRGPRNGPNNLECFVTKGICQTRPFLFQFIRLSINCCIQVVCGGVFM